MLAGWAVKINRQHMRQAPLGRLPRGPWGGDEFTGRLRVGPAQSQCEGGLSLGRHVVRRRRGAFTEKELLHLLSNEVLSFFR